MPSRASRRPPATGAAEPMERIALVVEDDERAADLVRLLLEAEGFTVLRAASAEAALSLVQPQPLSLITLDIQLPGMDGWEFLARLRDSHRLAHVPVVVIAGTSNSDVWRWTAAPPSVLQTPISRAQLKASLAILGLHPAQDHTYTVLVVDDDREGGGSDRRLPAVAGLRAWCVPRRARGHHPGATTPSRT